MVQEVPFVDDEKEQQVYDEIDQSENGLSITQLEDKLRVTRSALRPPLTVLLMTGRIEVSETYGNTILYDTK